MTRPIGLITIPDVRNVSTGFVRAAHRSWYGDDLETTTLFEPTLASADAPTQRVRINA
jgi:hypothetical protein